VSTDPNDKPFKPVKLFHIAILKPGQDVPAAGVAAPAAAKKPAAPRKK
jgi:hypothetical protein